MEEVLLAPLRLELPKLVCRWALMTGCQYPGHALPVIGIPNIRVRYVVFKIVNVAYLKKLLCSDTGGMAEFAVALHGLFDHRLYEASVVGLAIQCHIYE